jgi:predicted ATPase
MELISPSTLNTCLSMICISLLIYILLERKREKPETPRLQIKPRNRSLSEVDVKNIYRICVTGGPCAGKTTALTRIAERVSEMGFRVFLVPEAATMLAKGGVNINPQGADRSTILDLQAYLMELQMTLEDTMIQLASACGEKSLILCDRGVMDGSAYMEPDLWQALLDEKGWSNVVLRDKRYDAIIHLVTTANGAEDFYSLGNNEARYEGLEIARKIDTALQKAYVGHPHLYIIPNRNTPNGFDAKINESLQAVCRVIGLPMPSEHLKKFLIEAYPGIPIPAIPEHTIRITLEDTFLVSEAGTVDRIQKRGQSKSYTYTRTVKHKEVDNEYTVRKYTINSKAYLRLLDKRDKARKTLKRLRQCFVYDGIYMMLDTFLNVGNGMNVLRIETDSPVSEINIPDCFKSIKEVTDDSYSTEKLSKVTWYESSKTKEISLED